LHGTFPLLLPVVATGALAPALPEGVESVDPEDESWLTTAHPPKPAVDLTDCKRAGYQYIALTKEGEKGGQRERRTKRQRLPAFPPEHFVPAGRDSLTWSVPVPLGLASPFLVTVALTKFLPLPVGSTSTETEREPSPPLWESQTHGAKEEKKGRDARIIVRDIQHDGRAIRLDRDGGALV
jgi:hypothetical protein